MDGEGWSCSMAFCRSRLDEYTPGYGFSTHPIFLVVDQLSSACCKDKREVSLSNIGFSEWAKPYLAWVIETSNFLGPRDPVASQGDTCCTSPRRVKPPGTYRSRRMQVKQPATCYPLSHTQLQASWLTPRTHQSGSLIANMASSANTHPVRACLTGDTGVMSALKQTAFFKSLDILLYKIQIIRHAAASLLPLAMLSFPIFP